MFRKMYHECKYCHDTSIHFQFTAYTFGSGMCNRITSKEESVTKGAEQKI